MGFKAPTVEQRFVLDHVACLPALRDTSLFAAAQADIVEAVLEGAAALAERSWAPLNRAGDQSAARWAAGDVTMPPGFKDAYQSYVQGGWGSISAPVDYGGQGLPNVIGFAIAECFGGANMAFNLCPMLTAGAVEALFAHGAPDLKATYLSKLVSGEWPGTMNLTEPQAGSDVGALRTTAAPRSDGSWRIKGTKIFITYGEHDLTENIVHLVLARTPGSPEGTKGISLFLVPKILPDGSRNDLQCTGIEHKLGIHASPTCTMSFGDEDQCIGWLIGEERGGISAMFTMMNNARLNVALQGVEIAEGATQQALAYARNRVQSSLAGSPSREPVAIIEHPDVRRMLLQMSAQTQAIRSLVYAAAAEVDRVHLGLPGARQRLDLLTPLAKSHATDIGCEVASLGIQVHGGMGFIEETGAAQYLRDARIAPIYEGTNGIQAADLVGRKLQGDDGAAMNALIDDVLAEARHPALIALAQDLRRLTRQLLAMDIADRLAASSAYLTMTSVMTCGWLMERQGRIAAESADKSAYLRGKIAAVDWYLHAAVPAAAGLASQIEAASRLISQVRADDL